MERTLRASSEAEATKMTVTTGTPWAALTGILSALAVLAVPVGLVLVIVGLVQFFRPAETPPGPEEILKSRYAGGEISLSEYEEMLRTIRGDGP
jgi:uncharacterized membrane protein